MGLTLQPTPDYAEENGGVMVQVILSRTDGQRINLDRTIIVNLDLINGDAGGYCYMYTCASCIIIGASSGSRGTWSSLPLTNCHPHVHVYTQ